MKEDKTKLTLIENKDKSKQEEKQISSSTPAVMKKFFKLMHVNLLNNKAEYKSFSNFKPKDLR